MQSDNLDIDGITEARRKSIVETIQPISAGELKALGEDLFPIADHPWRHRFFEFVEANANCTFHLAQTKDRIHILYCHDREKGMWFVPGSGMGPLQAKGLAIMKEIVEGDR